MKILLYASPVWRRGTEQKVAGQPRPRSATVSAHTVRVPGAKGLVNLAEAVQNVALRLILPVWRITPIVSLQCEVSLPPVRLVLDYLRALYAIRLHALPRQHPVAVRLPAMVPAQEHRGLLQVRSRTNRGHLTMKTTPLLEMTRDVQNVERHGPGPEAPWLPTFEQQGFVTISFFEGSDKDTVAKQHNALIEAKAPTRSPCWCIQTARYRQRARQEVDLSSTEPAKTHGTRPKPATEISAQTTKDLISSTSTYTSTADVAVIRHAFTPSYALLFFLQHQHLLDPARLPSGQLDFEYLFNDKKGIALFAEYATISRAYSSTAAT
ncbi:hypothetical protein CF328_g6027 [Tilletia controversa]|nr:hypothetical protein CF328_g6027 [Tilletia controversa]